MSMPMDRPWPVRGIARGADWNPDQWPREVWLRDVELMVDAGVNLVTLPVFSWPMLEPADGEFTFSWLDDVLDSVAAAGIGVDLATATATPPAWLVRAFPEVLPVDASGVRLEYGSRQSYCLSAEPFIERTERLATRMAERYAKHPALAMWHVSNEYGDHVTRCYCSNCARVFRVWLEARYRDVDALNEAWGTAMWGQRYSSFAEIEPPRRSMAPANPTHTLDFARFSTQSINALFDREAAALRRITPDVPITTNFMTIMTDVDYWQLAPRVDLVSFDNYPDPSDPLGHVPAALNYGLMRGLAGRRPWMLLESATSAVSWREVNVPKEPGRNRLHAVQAVAHGSDAVMYFQWRASRVGAERFHSAVVGHRGEASRTLVETSGLWHELAAIEGSIVGTQVRSDVALVVDWESRWAMIGPETMPSNRLQWIEQLRTWHAALVGLGLTVDAVHPSGDLSQYRLVVMPSQFMLEERQAERLVDYVRHGGHLVVGPFSAVVDRDNHVHAGGAPGPLTGLLGVAAEEPWPIVEPVQLATESMPLTARDWTEWLEVAPDVEVLARYGEGPLGGRAAVTLHRDGNGSASYVSAKLDRTDMQALLRDAAIRAGMPVREDDRLDVEVVTRTDGGRDITFALNHGRHEARLRVPERLRTLLSDARAEGEVQVLPALGVLIVESAAGTPDSQHHQQIEVIA